MKHEPSTPPGTHIIGDWVARAACAGRDPNLWYPVHESQAKRAIAICWGCPVIKECDRAIHAQHPVHRHGVWAGTYYRGQP